MASIHPLIAKKYPTLQVLYQQDIKFSNIQPHIRNEIGKSIAVGRIWQELASQLGMCADDIEYASVLKDHKGCSVMNMFDIYKTSYKDSLLEIVHSLAKMGSEKVLTKIEEMWTSILTSHRLAIIQPNSPAEHQMNLSSLTNSRHSAMTENISAGTRQEEFTLSSSDCSISATVNGMNPSITAAKQYQQPRVISPCQHQAHLHLNQHQVGQSCIPSYDRTRAWVEKHSQIPDVKQENCGKSQGHPDNKGTVSVQLVPAEQSAVVNFCSGSDTNSLQAAGQGDQPKDVTMKVECPVGWNAFHPIPNGFSVPVTCSETTCSTHSCLATTINDGSTTMKLPPFSTSFRWNSAVRSQDMFTPLTPVPHANCSQQLTDSSSRHGSTGPDSTAVTSLSSTFFPTLPLSRSQERKLNGTSNSIKTVMDPLRKSPSCVGRVESCQFADSLRNSSVFITHLFRGRNPAQTKSNVFNNKNAITLGYCLKENRFRVQMDVPKSSKVPCDDDWRNWLDRKFSNANFIIVCVTEEYLDVVNAMNIEDSDVLMDNIQSTRYIYHLMQHEFEENGGINNRFIPVFFRDPQNHLISFLPPFLRTEGMGPYIWPRNYMDLLWRLDRHDIRLNNINRMR